MFATFVLRLLVLGRCTHIAALPADQAPKLEKRINYLELFCSGTIELDFPNGLPQGYSADNWGNSLDTFCRTDNNNPWIHGPDCFCDFDHSIHCIAAGIFDQAHCRVTSDGCLNSDRCTCIEEPGTPGNNEGPRPPGLDDITYGEIMISTCKAANPFNCQSSVDCSKGLDGGCGCRVTGSQIAGTTHNIWGFCTAKSGLGGATSFWGRKREVERWADGLEGPCPCNSTYISDGCCDVDVDGLVWEKRDSKYESWTLSESEG